MSVVDRLRARRRGRLVSFLSVGAVGMVVDVAITFALLGTLPPVAANAAGWAVAVTHNFAGNYHLTYGQPDGRLARQYVGYVGLHSVTFAFRAVVLTGVLAATALPATVASLVGIAAAAGLNFLGTERLFRGRAGAALNRLAHRVFGSRLRRLLTATGLYPYLFTVYARVLARVSPGPTETVAVDGATVELATATPTETVSVLHTLENERDVLAAFVTAVDPGDRVVDVGANVGVFTALALQSGAAAVDAVEAHGPTAGRLRANCPAARVHTCALGATVGTTTLGVTNDAAGTQRARVGTGTRPVRQLVGDYLATPDVLKVDVEGAEKGVLDGYRQTLADAAPHTVFVETHGSQADVVHTLVAAGYDITASWSVGVDETMLQATRQ